MSKKALLLGATGETGSEVLKCLRSRSDVEKIILVGRRNLESAENDPKIEQRIVNFDTLESFSSAFSGCDVAFSCLGTTRGKAGKDGFVKVDYDYVVNSAKLIQAEGCKDFHLLTSKGANPTSWFLYPATKGKAEEAVKALDFQRVSIYRPGLLMCDRQESRPGERVMRCIAGAVDKGSALSISTESLALAMVENAFKKIDNKCETLEHGDINRVAREVK